MQLVKRTCECPSSSSESKSPPDMFLSRGFARSSIAEDCGALHLEFVFLFVQRYPPSSACAVLLAASQICVSWGSIISWISVFPVVCSLEYVDSYGRYRSTCRYLLSRLLAQPTHCPCRTKTTPQSSNEPCFLLFQNARIIERMSVANICHLKNFNVLF